MNSKTEFKNGSWMWFKNLKTVQLVLLSLCISSTRVTAQMYRVLHQFNGSDGAWYCAGLTLSGSTLYGTKSQGGSNDCGVVFKVNTDGSGFAVLRRFIGGYDGYAPEGIPVPSGATLYGTTEFGGISSYGPYPISLAGTVFRVNTDGSGYEILKVFKGSNQLPPGPPDGATPRSGLALLGSTLYGTTQGGGGFGAGTVFKINTDASAYTVLKSFTNGSDGRGPLSPLVLSGTNLYGTTAAGGISNCGTLFKISIDGTGFTVLKQFAGGSDGGGPWGSFVLSGATLYGTTYGGFNLGATTVFKINTDGGGYTVLKDLTGDISGGGAAVGLVLSGTTLFGTTSKGGISDHGKLFKINTDGSGYTVLKQFAGGADGAQPCGNLVLSGSTMFGATASGGNPSYGFVFSFSLPPIIKSPPRSQTTEMGSGVDFTVEADSSSMTAYQWFFNGTNDINCTNSCLELANVQFSQSGVYTVVITNAVGAVTSAPVMLSVIPAVQRRPVPAINLMGEVGSGLHVEHTDALGFPANWLPLDTLTLTNTSQFAFDASEPLPPQRFYRVWQLESPGVVLSLSLPYMVPAIILTGNVGDKLRLDYINAIGPTDAWVTLDTVTLTNTSQLYFDVSAIGQPPRLWRIVPAP